MCYIVLYATEEDLHSVVEMFGEKKRFLVNFLVWRQVETISNNSYKINSPNPMM